LAAAAWTLVLEAGPADQVLPSGEVAAAPGPPPASAWHGAAAELLAAPEWIWNDTDKKGRPRQRDLRGSLNSLALESQGGAFSLRLVATIDAAGRSLRPEQLQHWFASRLGWPVKIRSVCRDGLALKQEPAEKQESDERASLN
jgi:hypothetical protein